MSASAHILPSIHTIPRYSALYLVATGFQRPHAIQGGGREPKRSLKMETANFLRSLPVSSVSFRRTMSVAKLFVCVVVLACVGSAVAQTYSHSQALSILNANGISVSSSGGCSNRQNPKCTSLDGIHKQCIDGSAGTASDSFSCWSLSHSHTTLACPHSCRCCHTQTCLWL